jgi:F0F1-type ATP synthase membrane subunit a
MQLLSAMADPLEEVLPHTYFHVGRFGFTNHMMMALIAALLMLLIFPRLFNRPDSGVPTGSKNFFESILEFLRLEVFRPALKEHTDRFVPFLWSLFFFILFCNVLGAIPLATIVELLTGGHVTHFGGAATGNISTTAALAICAFFFIHAQGIDTLARSLMDGTYGKHAHHEDHSTEGKPPHETAQDIEHARGEALPADVPGNFDALRDPTAHYRDDEYRGGHSELDAIAHGEPISPLMAILLAVPIYLWNFAPHPFRPGPGEPKTKWLADIPMFLFLLVLELFGALVKPFALCLRLFGNMVAGHVLLAVLLGLIVAVPTVLSQLAVGLPLGLLHAAVQLLEIFVAFLQAYIFTFLTTLFLASAVAPEH